VIEVVIIIDAIRIGPVGVVIAGEDAGLDIETGRDVREITREDDAGLARGTERLLRVEERVRGIAEFIVEQDVKEIGRAEFIDRGNLANFDLELAVEEALLIPELVDALAFLAGNAAGQRIDLQVIARQVPAILPDAGDEELAVKVRKLLEIDIGRSAEPAEVGRVVRLAAGNIGEEIANIIEVEGNALVGKPGPFTAPIAEEILLMPEVGLDRPGGRRQFVRAAFLANARIDAGRGGRSGVDRIIGGKNDGRGGDEQAGRARADEAADSAIEI
jgi:hypothetical protein